MIEYPPILKGSAENQTAQIRAYLVRLVQVIDNMLGKEETPVEAYTPEKDPRVNALIQRIDRFPMMQYGTVSEAGAVTFPSPFGEVPVVFVSAGAASSISETGFTASAAASWIAVGARRAT